MDHGFKNMNKKYEWKPIPLPTAEEMKQLEAFQKMVTDSLMKMLCVPANILGSATAYNVGTDETPVWTTFPFTDAAAMFAFIVVAPLTREQVQAVFTGATRRESLCRGN